MYTDLSWIREKKERGRASPRIAYLATCVCVYCDDIVLTPFCAPIGASPSPGYATVFLPGYLVIRYVRHTNFLERNGQKCMDGIVKLFVYGNDESIDEAITFDVRREEGSR